MLASNSSTLILISKIELLSKFLDAVKTIAITEIVYEEISKKDSFENLVIKKEVEKGRIKIEAVETKPYFEIIKQFKLDEGEASTFALCVGKKFDGVMTDDKELIKLCKIEGIEFISAMSILVMLFRNGIIDKNETIEKLDELQAYGRYSKEIYDHFKGLVR